MNEELLQALEEAHANGYDLNWAKKFAIDNNGADLIPQIEDFYKKKKDLAPRLVHQFQAIYL